ncbi:HhH-GDP family DNA glycosylase [Thalassoroseus pseudoceratinae]|uniref:hypothetical protein n=1 Tax=Thalassoroseus pseudoceratinae TaxID=2713176 RepID=UPI0014243071|nr:hypothetical protein [Thalassoroseus pseudoceratinae]
MASAQKPKNSDKQAVCKKLVTALKKQYKGSSSTSDLPVLETLVFAVCLEDTSEEQAEKTYQRLHESFFDLNEIRVSSISELAAVFEELPDAELRGMMVRNLLQHVFEKHYDFDLEDLKRKTLEQAVKQLEEIPNLSPFVRNYALQTCLGSHLVPADRSTTYALIWLGLVEAGQTPEEAADSLKPVIRKAEGPQFCSLIRSLAVDPKYRETFDPAETPPPEDGYDLMTSPNRLKDLFENGPKKSASSKSTSKSSSSGSRKKSGSRSSSSGTKSSKKSTGSRKTSRQTKS